jgi:hypothetical protein
VNYNAAARGEGFAGRHPGTRQFYPSVPVHL